MRRRASTLETLRALPAFLLAVALSLVIFAGIQRGLPRAEGPGLLPVYLCGAVVPAFLLVFGLGAAIRSSAREDRPPLAITPVHVMILGTAATLTCIGLAAWPSSQRTPTAAPTAPTASESADPATRARALARRAVVQRLSEAGVEGLQLDARRITRDGTAYWRVTTRGVITDYVIDVGEGTRLGPRGEQEPVIDVFDAGAAPREDLAVEAPEGMAPVSSQ
jgi:hypothetical protein